MKHLNAGILHITLLLACMAGFKFAGATITVTSVNVTTSTCPNNGTAKVNATSTRNNAVFLFNIITGPVTYPEQNDSTFYSLYPGNYTGWVHDVNSFDSTEFAFSVTGDYVYPTVTISDAQPTCSNSGNGTITGHVSAGLAPYRWQIISPDSTALQSSNTFTGLDSGFYSIRVVDGCGVGRVTTAILDSVGAGLENNGSDASIIFYKCDSAAVYWDYKSQDTTIGYPLKFMVTVNGYQHIYYQVPVPDPRYNSYRKPYLFRQVISGLQYNDSLSVCVSDTCGYTICAGSNQIVPFQFITGFASAVDCNNHYTGNIVLNLSQYESSVITFSPITVSLYNQVTHTITFDTTVADSGGLDLGDFLGLPSIPGQVPGTYLLTVKDTCQNVYTDNIQWPAAPQPSCFAFPELNIDVSIDSTAAVVFQINGFSATATMEILSGPPLAKSTKPGYAYRDTIIYPKYYKDFNAGPNNTEIGNFPLGNYTYLLYDSCGRQASGSFSVVAVNSFGPDYVTQHFCSGISTLKVIYPIISGDFQLSNLAGTNFDSVEVYVNSDETDFPSLSPGTYIFFAIYNLGQNPAALDTEDYTYHKDTIVIKAYNDSTLRATDVVQCNGTINLYLEVDSANGIPPFKYEIIGGPDTAAPQNSPYFIVNQFGTYQVGVIDSCGNIDARYVTADTGRFDPVVRSGGLCGGSAVKLYDVSSPFFTYVWTLPNGTTYTGDTLYISQLNNTDTGTYNIKKIVQINGCRDSAFGTYHLIYQDTFMHTVLICPGDTAYLDGHAYTNTGFYTDTLQGAFGCDSINILNLRVAGLLTTLNDSICQGDTVFVGGHAYTLPGNYTDSLINGAGCDSVINLTLNVNPAPVVTLSWVQLVQQGLLAYIYGEAGDTGICLQQNTHTIPLTGGTPTGGTYSGLYVANNTLYVDSFIAHQPGTNADTITYTAHVLGCANQATNYIFIEICGGITPVADDNGIKIHPNPTTGQLTITTQNFTPQTITIYDDAGRLISTLPFKNEIDLSTLSSGVYFMAVTGSEGVVRKRVVKM